MDTDGERSEQGEGSLLHVTLQQEHDGRVALRRLFELFQRDLVVVVLIHFAEDLVHPLLWCQTVLVHLHHDHSAHHLVDSLRGEVQGEISRAWWFNVRCIGGYWCVFVACL